MEKYIELALGSHMISHGYDSQNKEVTELIDLNVFSKKVIAVSRIKSLSEKYILTDYLDGRWIYWEYEGDYETIKNLLLEN